MDERDYKAMNEELNQPSCLGAVSSSSFFDWRNDEYNDVDEDFYDNEPEHSHEAENCHCAAYKWSNGRWLHVSDCCC